MHKLSRIAFFAFSLLLAVAAHAVPPALTSLSLAQGSAGGGTTLHVYGTDFGTPGVSAVSVLVGGEYCQNTLLVAAGDIQCQMPVGVPGSTVDIAVYVDGVVSSNTLPFDYFPRPQLQDTTVVTGYNNTGQPIVSPAVGAAGGGDTLVLHDYNYNSFQAYAPYQGQPRDLKVFVGSNECLNPVLHWNDDLGNYFIGDVITCTTPAGTPGDYDAEIKLFINGVQDQQSAQCNGCGYFFEYLPRPQMQPVSVVSGYGSNGAPILNPNGAMGSAGGGDTLLLRSSNTSFWNYAPWQGQPRDVTVYVGGNECLNPVLHWNDNFSSAFGQGNAITCTTPAGMPGDVDAEVTLFINGVQDSQSAACNGCGYFFEYLQRPQMQPVSVVMGYDNNGAPMPILHPNGAWGSQGGGDTLLLRSVSSSFLNYAPSGGQPRDLKVFVGGNECLNPVLHWVDDLGNYFGPGNAITCITPAESGNNPTEIQLFINGVQDQQSAQCNGCGDLFQYIRPVLAVPLVLTGYDYNGDPMFDPGARGSAAGGDTLVLQSNFNLYARSEGQPRDLTVYVGGNECLNPVLHWNDSFGNAFVAGNVITCTTPAGTPGDYNAEIALFINGAQDMDSAQGNGYVFEYLPRPLLDPVDVVMGFDNLGLPILSLNGVSGSAGGGDTLLISSANLSFENYTPDHGQPRDLTVYVGGNECLNPVLHWNDVFGNGYVITCTTPAGTPGSNAEIKLFINGVQDEQSAQCNGCGDVFEYWSRPTINGVDRLVLDPGTGTEITDWMLEGSPAGGTRLQIDLSHEFNLGITPNWQVMIGAAPCANVQYDAGNQSITCFTPAGSAGSTVPVRVWQDGMPANENDPAVFSFQYRDLPQMSQLSPEFGFAGGGSTLVVEGNFFADAFSQIAVRVGNNLCSNATLVNPTMIECTLPRGVVGTTVPVTVSIDGANTPTPNALLFTYDAAPQLISLTPDYGPLSGGNLLEIEGANFGNFVGGMPLSVPMVLVGNKLCSNPVFTDETHLLCIVPSGVTAATVNVSVFVDGIAAGNTLPYSYTVPAFSNITPAEGLPAGGYPVVISGSDLGVPGQTSVAVKIGSKYCSSPVLVVDSEIHCTMPAGTGTDLPVTVYLNGQAKITGLTFSYVTPVPVLQSVTPAQGVASGGTLITLSGSYFNTIGASVMVGNSVCTVQSQTEQEIVCTTTAGDVGMQALTVTVDGNTSNTLLFEYTGAMPLNGIFRGSSVQDNTGTQ